MGRQISQLDMFEAFAAPPTAMLPEPEDIPTPPPVAAAAPVAVSAVVGSTAAAAPRPLSPRPPRDLPAHMRPTGPTPLGPAPRAPAEGIIIAPRDREFVVRPFDQLKVDHFLLAGNADQRAAFLCRVSRVTEDTVETVILGFDHDNRMRFCRETGVLLDASFNRQRCDHETVHNSGIKIRATGPMIDRNGARTDVSHGALMRAFQAQIPPLPKGTEAEFLAAYEPLPPPAFRR